MIKDSTGRLAEAFAIAFPDRAAAPAASAMIVAGALAALAYAGLLSKHGTSFQNSLYTGLSRICHTQLNSAAMETAEQRPRPATEIVSSEKLAHLPGKNISVVRVKFPPGGLSPRHYHGGSVTIYVLSGTIRSQLEGAPAATYGPGETFFEPLGAIHLFAENVSTTEPAEVLAVFVHDQGAALTTYF